MISRGSKGKKEASMWVAGWAKFVKRSWQPMQGDLHKIVGVTNPLPTMSSVWVKFQIKSQQLHLEKLCSGENLLDKSKILT